MKVIRQKRTILTYFVLAYIVVTVIFSIYRYFDESKKLEKEIKVRLQSGAATIKYILPDGYFDRAVNANSISDAEYRKLTDILSKATWEGKYKYLYALKEKDGKYYFIASNLTRKDLSDKKYEPYWLEYSEAPPSLAKAFRTHKAVFSKVSDRWGTFFSAFCPEYSPTGQYYVVGADYEYDVLRAALASILYSSVLQALILLVLLFLIYITLSRLQKHYILKLQNSNTANEAAPIGVMSLQPDGIIDYVNPVLAGLIGLPVDGMEGFNIHNNLGFYKNDELINRIRFCLDRQLSWHGEFSNTSLNGKEYWVNAIINYITPQQGGKGVINVFAEDVTAQMKSRISLAQHNKIQKFISDTVHNILANADLDKILPQVLSQYGQNLSKSYVAILKNNYNNYEIYSSWQFSDSSHTFIPHLSQVQNRRQQYIDWEQMGEAGEILAGESYDFPLSLITLAKVSGPGFIHLCPIFCDNKYWGFLLTLQTQRADIIDAELEKYVLRTISDSIGSALKRYEINLELRKSVEVKTQFMSSMSHEIRTPLNGIVGMINLMESTLLTAEQKEYLAAVRSAGKQLMNLINNILDISRIEAGKTVLRSEPFELGACIKAATSIVNYELKEKSLTLNVRIDAALPRVVKGDETRLKQIIVNLLHNSIKFTDSGTISVEIQRLSKKKLKFTVSDTGIGMTKEQIKNIFQPFYQAGDAAQNLKGTGLGLAISKQLVDMMNGKIVVESEPGKGTSITFSAELPILEESEFYSGMEVKPSEALPNHISGTTTQRNILFLLGSDLDDKVMQSYLFSKGYNHRIAYSWQEVLEQIDNEHTLLIIINLSQSNLEHPELIPALKKAFVDYPSKRWLVLAAFSCDDLHDETFPADRVACQAKPLDFDKILLYIQNAVEQGRMELESKTRGMKLEKH